jgi:hypothetical protein
LLGELLFNKVLLKTKIKNQARKILLACLHASPSLLASFLGFGYFWLDLLPLVSVDRFTVACLQRH